MEGRMMLSASGIEDMPVDLSQYTITPVNISFVAADVTPTTPHLDGGYIHPDGLYTNADGTFTSYLSFNEPVLVAAPDPHGTAVAGITRTYGVSGQDVNATSGWQLSSIGDSYGLQPLVIVSQTNSGGLAPDLKPIVLGPNPSPSTPSAPEGGAIPIHAIFADFRKDSQLASGVKAVATPAVESSIESLTAARQLPTSDNALPGEWARAAVFEIAGGEPTANDLHSLNGQNAKTSDNDTALKHAEPLSSVRGSHQNLKLANVGHTVARPTDDTSTAEMATAQAEQQSRQVAAVVMQLLDSSQLAAGFSAPLSASQFSACNLLITENSDPAAFAAAAVFDQLGEEHTAVIESSIEGKSWLRSIGTSPLLMMLALERIAALNSRRGARESRIAPTKKPLHLHG
jgi:hypothetical protein